MRKQVIRTLLQRNIILRRKSDELADAFASVQEGLARRQLSEFFGRLHTGITVNIGRQGGKAVVSGMLRDLNLRFDTAMIADIYEKTAVDTAAYIRDAKKLLKKADIEFVFNEIDTETLEMIRNSFFWMQADHTDVLIEEVKAVIEAAFAGEIAREALPKYLEDRFGEIIKAESRYFREVSDHIISQGQNMARVAQGSKYDVKYYQVMARLDSRTTRFCRSVHGRIIPADHVEKQGKRILAARNSYEKKNAAAWPKSDAPFCGKTLPDNIGVPPYHYRCRTILQPVWPSEEEIKVMGESIKVKNTRPGSEGLFSHIDNTGVERYIPAELYGKGHKSEKPGPGGIVKTAPHADFPGRTVAMSANGYFMVFGGQRLVSIFAPENLKKYFGRNAVTAKAEVIKWESGGLLSGLYRAMTGRWLKRA